MDIKKKYFDLIKEKIEEVYKCQSDKMSEVAALFGSCMENEGVVQLFGVAHGEEFVNELNYRAGGIARRVESVDDAKAIIRQIDNELARVPDE